MSHGTLQNGATSNGTRIGQNATETVHLLFVGAPLLDISVKCDEETRRYYGLKSDDCILSRKEHDELFQQIFHNPESHLAAGGSAQNAARIAKWKLGPRGEVAFAGSTGCDDYETWMRSKLCADGVVPLYVKLPNDSTGLCACLLSEEGERSMIARQGAAALFLTEHLRTDLIRPYVGKSNCIFVEGYFIVHSPGVIFSFAEHRASSQIFSISLSAEYVCRSHCAALMKVIPKVDVLFGNEAEVRALAEAICKKDNLTVQECVKLIHCIQISEAVESRIFVVTRGSKPLIVAQGTEEHQTFTIDPVENVVDSVGCGDALAGAFLADYVTSRNISSAVKAGIEAATKILQVAGCDPPH